MRRVTSSRGVPPPQSSDAEEEEEGTRPLINYNTRRAAR
jgi:hypothetical protein